MDAKDIKKNKYDDEIYANDVPNYLALAPPDVGVG